MAHMHRIFVLLGAMAAVVKSDFTVTDCGSSSKVVAISNAQVSPDPVAIPGVVTASIDVEFLQDIDGDHYTVDLNIKRVLPLFDFPVPCVEGVGSCQYELCNVLEAAKASYNGTACPSLLEETSPGFPCSCPIPAGIYSINPTTVMIPEISGLLQTLAQGDYIISATLTDTSAPEQEIACAEMTVTVEKTDE